MLSISNIHEQPDTKGFVEAGNGGQPVYCAIIRALTFDGEMNYGTIRKLEKSIEHQTGVHPVVMFEHCKTVTATDIVQLILSWRIIHRRIFMEERAKKKFSILFLHN